jgi:DNA-binding MarR family transcriptional regulator
MDQRDIGYLLNRATRQFRMRFAERLADAGLRPQQAAVLMAVSAARGGRLTPSAVATAIDSDAATTTELLKRMVRDGWLLREPNPADGRSSLLALSDRARDAIPGVARVAEAVSAEAVADLSAAERETLAELLQRLGGERGSSGGVDSARGLR